MRTSQDVPRRPKMSALATARALLAEPSVAEEAEFLERRTVLVAPCDLLGADDVVERGDEHPQAVDVELDRVHGELFVAC